MDEYISVTKFKESLAKLTVEGGTEATRTAIMRTLSEVVPQLLDDEPAADVQPVNQWISIKDRLPEIGKSVLIYYPKWDGDEIQVAKLEGDGMMFDICGEFNIGTGAITHWMPLPEPPKDGEHND